jgi:glycosyltransferase involved in cell wall biosynthesis
MSLQAILPAPLRSVYLVAWWFADFGGMERHIVELAKALHRRGVSVTVFTEMPVPRRNQYRAELRRSGIPFVSPPIPRPLVLWWQRRFPATPAPAHSGAIGPSLLARLLQSTLERRSPPALVHVHGWLLRQWTVPWCAARSIPSVYTEHSTISDWGGPSLPDSPRFLSSAGDLACVSESARRALAPWFPGRSISLHRHIVPLPEPSSDAPDSGPLRILCVARLRAEKGIDLILRAAAQLLPLGLAFSLELAGDGPQRAELLALSRSLGLARCVHFSGSAPARAIHEKMRRAHIFVLPSRTEAMPLALLEAMSHGLAIVAASVGGIPEVIADGESGLLVPPESAASLAAAIRKVLCDANLRASLSRNARARLSSGPYSEPAALATVLASYELARSGVCAE